MTLKTYIYEDELPKILELYVDDFPSVAAAARALGVSRGHLSRVLNGKKPITPNLIEALGYVVHEVLYRRLKQ